MIDFHRYIETKKLYILQSVEEARPVKASEVGEQMEAEKTEVALHQFSLNGCGENEAYCVFDNRKHFSCQIPLTFTQRAAKEKRTRRSSCGHRWTLTPLFDKTLLGRRDNWNIFNIVIQIVIQSIYKSIFRQNIWQVQLASILGWKQRRWRERQSCSLLLPEYGFSRILYPNGFSKLFFIQM